jgi:UDP-N-acetylmuramate dehydrogenase
LKPTAAHIERIRKLLAEPPGSPRADRFRAVETGYPLKRLTSFGVGGPADVVASPQDLERLRALLEYVWEEGLNYLVLGRGTNTLFADAGARGVIIRTTELRALAMSENGSGPLVTAESGVALSAVLGKSARLGLGGAEPLWGVPGSFGGAIAGNAGSGGVSVGDLLKSVTLLATNREVMRVNAENLEFQYRRLVIPPGSVILSGELRMERMSESRIREGFRSAMTSRARTQPRSAASAGCVFKNPSADNPAGLIIDRLGLKGKSIGGAYVSEVHANFIVNRGSATAEDVKALMRFVQRCARERAGVNLEPEIMVFNEDLSVAAPMVE